ncbi:MAG: hypothetical protein ACREJD_07055 [Phycisphaerales bacterium]
MCRKMDGDDSERLAAAMTSQFGCRAIIALNADDDVLWLCGYDRGERIGEYDSSTPQRSGAGHIAGVAGRSFATPILWIIFQMPFVFELFRHLAACKVLGLPGDICTYGYPGDDEDRILPGVPEGLFQATDEGYLC